MAQHQTPPPPPKKKGLGIGSLLLYVTIFSIGGLLLFKYFKNSGGANPFDYTSVPQEMQVNYVPSDFKYEMDEENTIAILINPHRYRREFNELVYNFNLSMLYHVANRMNLPDSLKQELPAEYEKHHPYLKQLYFNDFVNLRDTTGNEYEAWYDNESTGAVDVMNEVASKYTCFLVNHVIMTMLEAEDGKINAKGSRIDTPCGIALTEALRPMVARLQDRAAVNDFTRSKGMLEERVEKVIAELATMEVRDKKGLNKQLQTKVWGYAVSSSDIEVSAISMLKVGFKLDDYFNVDINQKSKLVTITLPEPRILSHEVYPKIDKLDIGWMREVKDFDLNKNFNLLRGEFRRDALNSDIMDKAKDNAESLMVLMFEPLVKNIHKNYKVRVKYKNMGYAEYDELPDYETAKKREAMNKGTIKEDEVPY